MKNMIINSENEMTKTRIRIFSADLSVSSKLNILLILSFGKRICTNTNNEAVKISNIINTQKKQLISPLIHAAASNIA